MEEKKEFKPGDREWNKIDLYVGWQVIRRDPEFIKFCDKYSHAFDKDDELSQLDPTNLKSISEKKEYEEIKNLFGLEVIYHPSVDVSIDHVFDWPFFKKDEAVDGIKREGHLLTVEIDITRTDQQIKGDTFGLVNWHREDFEKEKKQEKRPRGRLRHDILIETFKVWDLHKKGKSPKEIAEEVWPDEYEKGWAQLDDEKGELWKELQDKYDREGFEDWAERACKEAYGDYDKSGRIKFYMRINERLKRMKDLFKRFKHY